MTYPITTKFEQDLDEALSQGTHLDPSLIETAKEYIGENEHDTPEGVNVEEAAKYLLDFLLYANIALDTA